MLGGEKRKMNKKRIALGIGIVLTVLTMFTASASASNLLYFVPLNSSAAPNETVTVKLMLNTTHDDIGAFQCHIDLNTDVVNVISGSEGSWDWDYWNWTIKNDPEYGPYLFTAGMEFGGCGPGELELGIFTLKGVNPGVSPLDFIRRQQPGEPEPHPDPTTIRDTSNNLLPFNWTNGTFTCLAPQETYSKDLVEGWNLISLPLTADDMTASSVFSSVADKYDAIYSYDATTHSWVALGADDTLENGVGYFIHMTSADTWTYQGSAYLSMSVPLEPGLNMVGWLNCSKPIDDALSSIEGNYRYVARWNSTAHKFEVYVPGAPSGFNDFNTMERGEGYFISMKTSDTLTASC
mgnify:CR=1 FL=1